MDSDMKYLGLPLISKRISLANCLPLYGRIIDTFKTWTNRQLSQSGRLVLIKSITFPMMVTWVFFMILLCKLLRLIRSSMLRYIWTVSIHFGKPIPCSFTCFEDPLNRGGLGLTNLKMWNIAAFSEHFDDFCWIGKTPDGWNGFGITILGGRIFGTLKLHNCAAGLGERHWD